MVKKQFIAQVGVFLLLGLNVAAYWFLWPNYHSASSSEGKAPSQERGTTRLVPEAPAKAAPPQEVAPSSLKDAVPLSLPASAPQPAPMATPEQETISKLFEQIKKDGDPPPLVTLPLEPAPAAAQPPADKPGAPNPLPLIPAEPLRGEIAIPPVAVASALTPKMQPSPWLLNMEMVGPRTQLFAKVKQPGSSRVVAEFKILCDRIEMKSPGGELQALGKVTITGPGLNASCQRLTLPIHETRLMLEENAIITQDNSLNGVLRGERITWEMPASPPPHPAVPAALGLPK